MEVGVGEGGVFAQDRGRSRLTSQEESIIKWGGGRLSGYLLATTYQLVQ